MPIDAKFLVDTLSGESDNETKVQKILTEYGADTNGLKLTNGELKAEKQKALDKLKDLESKNSEYDGQLKELQEKMKKAGTEDAKAFYDTQIQKLTAENKTAIDAISIERDAAYTRLTEHMSVSEFEKALDGNTAIKPAARSALRKLFYAEHKFERKIIDGQEHFLDKDNKTVKDSLTAYFQTPEAKDLFLQETSTGGGASGSHSQSQKQTQEPKTAKDALAAALAPTE